MPSKIDVRYHGVLTQKCSWCTSKKKLATDFEHPWHLILISRFLDFSFTNSVFRILYLADPKTNSRNTKNKSTAEQKVSSSPFWSADISFKCLLFRSCQPDRYCQVCVSHHFIFVLWYSYLLSCDFCELFSLFCTQIIWWKWYLS